MDRQHMTTLYDTYRNGLLQDVLPFWFPRSVDREYGGFLTARDRDGTLLDDDKFVWQQCRFSWLLAALCNRVERNEAWLTAARNTLAFLKKNAFDTDGRMFFHLTRDGRPIRKRRYHYTETFYCIALAETAKATGDEQYADEAVDVYSRYQEDLARGCSPAKFTGTRQDRAFGPLMIDIATCRVLLDTIGHEPVGRRIDQCLDEIERYFVKDDIRCVMETVAQDGSIIDHFDGRTVNPGHAIEAAWFILREAHVRGGDTRLVGLGTRMLDYMWERGWDPEYGGLFYFRDVYGKPVQEYWHDMKFWWPHNEAVTATLMAYRATGDEKYADWHRQVHDWAYGHFPDAGHGEWFGYLHRDGRCSVPLKGNMWKGPFHLPRMQLVCSEILMDMMHNDSKQNREAASLGEPHV